MDIVQFQDNLRAGKNFIFSKTITAKSLGIMASFLKLKQNYQDIIFCESSEKVKSRGRYSIIAVSPDKKWIFQDEEITLKNLISGQDQVVTTEPIAHLKAIIAEDKISDFNGLPVMAAGWFGYLGYDMVKYYDNIQIQSKGDIIPDSYFIRPEVILIFDNLEQKLHISLPIWAQEVQANDLYEKKHTLMQKIESHIVGAGSSRPESINIVGAGSSRPESHDNFTSYPTKSDYISIIAKCKDYIREGEVFQIVPSRRFETDFTLDPACFYQALREINPSPFLFYYGFDDFVITGSSPEIMVRIDEDNVTIRPLAGTRKRGNSEAEDIEIAEELLSDPKEVAEHLMLLDLGRHDVGRVAVNSTVRVLSQMVIEYYSHVMHISSTVTGKLRPDLTALDALLAGFPAGTVTGAPKIRAMQILAELEQFKRGFYAGCIGYFSANGENMDMAITLRTALIKDQKLYIQAGAGVVYDSDPVEEYLETERKAAALLEACRQAILYQ
ncbi:MAG: anthranilate synthase component I [Rickettsiales bacterium]|jgi:anthranilate synthase component I|nr:anthranilate synthase component I [Rickettsiales bacterium]